MRLVGPNRSIRKDVCIGIVELARGDPSQVLAVVITGPQVRVGREPALNRQLNAVVRGVQLGRVDHDVVLEAGRHRVLVVNRQRLIVQWIADHNRYVGLERHGEVGRGALIPIFTTEEHDGRRKGPGELMFDANAVLAVERPSQIGIDSGIDSAAPSGASADLTRLRVEIAVGIGPRTAIHRQLRRILAVNDADSLVAHVDAGAPLHHGAGVAKQVVRDAEPRHHVAPGLHVDFRIMPLADPRSGRRRLFRHPSVELVVAHASVDGEPLPRSPGVLQEESGQADSCVVVGRCIGEIDRVRSAVAEAQDDIAVPDPCVLVEPATRLNAGSKLVVAKPVAHARDGA